MVGYSFFQTSTLGMRSQAYALSTIGQNVANVNTGGFKRTDTRFETVLSQTIGKSVSDIGGVKPKDFQMISSQGVISSTSRDLDLAIVGDGFFEVSPDFDVSGETLYTRDGSFRVATVNDITVPGAGYTDITTVAVDDNGNQLNPVTSKDGYLVDKNGYYVLGWAAETDGSFTNTGTPAPLRVDQYAFANTFTPTTTGSLRLNLPSDALEIADHASTVLAANSGTNNPDLYTYTAEIVDSTGAKQTARINMTKSDANTWEMSATTSRASSPQTDTVVISGTVDVGDQYNVTVDGTTVSYITAATDTTLANVRDGLLAAINADVTIAAKLTATSGSANGEITLTANAPATTFATSATSSDNGNIPQTDTVTIAGAVIAGEQYTVTVDGTPVTYTVTGAEADLNAVRTGIIGAINADVTVGALVTAGVGALPGEITLTAKTATLPFTGTVATGVITSNTAANANTTANTPGVAQVDTATFDAAYEPGDQYRITIGGVNYDLTTAGGSDAPSEFIAAHSAALNTAGVTVTRVDATNLTFTANTPGTPFAPNAALVLADNGVAGASVTTANVTPNTVPIAQVDTVTITAADTAGETYAVTVDGNTVSYTVTGTEGGLAGIRTAFVAAINADATVGPLVTAAAGGAAGELTLTAATAGTAFTNAVSTPPDTAANTATSLTTTTNALTTNDSGVTVGTKTSNQTTASTTVNFTQLGVLTGTAPTIVNFALAYSSGASNTFALDISDMTQFGDDFVPFSFKDDGLAAANMSKVSFDTAGHVMGTFDDGTQRKIYKIPLAKFSNPNGLEMKNGMVFAESENSGAATRFAADTNSATSFNPFSIELSNVDLATEFSQMIMVQNAYNSNATVFKTVDEMTMVARDLKA